MADYQSTEKSPYGYNNAVDCMMPCQVTRRASDRTCADERLQVSVATKEAWQQLLGAQDLQHVGVLKIYAGRTAGDSAWQGPTLQDLDGVLLKAKNMHTLSLCGCNMISMLPSSITDLQFLTSFCVSECACLVTLPDGFSELPSLEKLEVSECAALARLPDNLPATLKVLDVSECSGLTALPSTLGELRLTKIDVQGCKALIDIPGSLQNCSSLSEVVFERNSELQRVVGRQLLEECSASNGNRYRLQHNLGKVIKRASRQKAIVKLSSDQLHMIESLERLSWLAVMLATATFVGFLQPPFGTIVNQENKPDAINKAMPIPNKAFFLLDAWSFLLSLSALVVIVVISMPHLPSSNKRREAGRFWILLCAAWGLLYFAIMTGAGAFVASAFAVYGNYDMHGLIAPLAVGVTLLLLGFASLVWRMSLLYPGPGVLVEGIAQIWKHDLPFCAVFPCTNLLVHLSCVWVTYTRNPGKWQGWFQDCVRRWRCFLEAHQLISESFVERHQRVNTDTDTLP